MKKKLAYLILLVVFVFTIFLFNTASYAGSQKLNNLHYDVKLNADGSADVVENWNIRVEETNTLFKTFDTDNSKYGEITNVNVSEVLSNGSEIDFANTREICISCTKGRILCTPKNL